MQTYDETSIQDAFTSNPVTIVMFGAPWCGPCKGLKPKFETLMSGGQVGFGYCNLEENPALATKYQIMNLPTFIVFRGDQPQKVVATSLEGEVKKLVTLANEILAA